MAAYYNEFDPFAAQWLRNLIAADHIAPGDVDERDLWDVPPDDLRPYARTVGSPQFMPPGETLVLLTPHALALFGWWRPHPSSGIVAMNGLDGWTCTIFRNTGPVLSSSLILDAELWLYGVSSAPVGPDGLITYVWDSKVASANPGYCFKRAGYRATGRSADGKKTLLQKAWPPCA